MHHPWFIYKTHAQGLNLPVLPRTIGAADPEPATFPVLATLLVVFTTTPFPCKVFFVMPGGFAVLRAGGPDLGTIAAAFDGGLVTGMADSSVRFSSSFTLFRAFFR